MMNVAFSPRTGLGDGSSGLRARIAQQETGPDLHAEHLGRPVSSDVALIKALEFDVGVN